MTSTLYDGKVEVSFTSSGHAYKINGTAKLGVTTPLKILPKDGLMQWAANMAVSHIQAAYSPTITTEEWDALCKKAKYAHLTYRDDKAEVGKRVHNWLDKHIGGEDLDYDELMAPSIESYLKWEAEAKPKHLFSERVVYSQNYDYCGTVDNGSILNGKYTILDFKTGKPDSEYNQKTKRYTGAKRAYTEHLAQVGGYDIAISEEDERRAEQYAVMYLPLDGSLYLFTAPPVFGPLFLSCLETYRLLEEAKRLNKFERR